jgi:hypothetical protein
MHAGRTVAPLAALVLALVGAFGAPLPASPAPGAAPAAGSAPTEPAPPFDPCALLDRETLLAVQGVALLDTRASDLRRGGLRVAACFFRGVDHSRSVSLEVALPSDAGAARPRERWHDMFHSDEASAGSREENEEHRFARSAERPDEDEGQVEREGVAPVAGLGDEAFYIGTAAYGALYVLRGDRYFRLSCGGPGNLDAKLARARALAERVISKLSA